MKIGRMIRSSIHFKIVFSIFFSITTAILIWAFFAVNGFNNLKKDALKIINREMEGLVFEYYENYINQVSHNIDQVVDSILEEIHILSGITQTYMIHREEFLTLSEEMDRIPYFKDRLREGDSWIDNHPDEPTELFIPRYLLGDDMSVSGDIKNLIEDTRFLDLILPVFKREGIKKIQVFFQGGKNREIFRMAPWYGIGDNIYAIYPEMNELPIWETFNPGLAEQWEQMIRSSGGDSEALNSLYRITPPVQDGLTGNIVLTVSQPIAGNDYTTFEGTVSYDIPIDYIIDSVEEIRFSQSGFAFLAQSNGNIFGINEYGQEILGFTGYSQHTIDEGEGFNRLKRFPSDSTIEEVKTLDLMGRDKPFINSVEILGKEYFLVLKRLTGYQSWLPEKGFFKERWTLGFVVPKEEVIHALLTVDQEIARQMNLLRINSIGFSVIILTVLLGLLFFSINQIANRLNRLAIATDDMSKRNYNIELTDDSPDEIGRLSRAFNEMSREIRKNISQLSSEADEYMKLFESVPDPVVVHDSDSNPLFINTAFKEVLGWTKEELISGESHLDLSKAQINNVYEAKIETKEGVELDVSITCAPYSDAEGKRIGTVYNLRNITQWKKAREVMIQSEKILSFGTMASGMAHEIKNPLAGAVQNAQNIYNRIIRDNPKNREAAAKVGLSREKMNQYMEEREIPKMIDAIINSVKDANKSIDYMLSFDISQPTQLKEADICQLLEKALRRLPISALMIERDYDENLPLVQCDSEKLLQSFFIVFRNSLESYSNTPEKKKVLKLRVYRQSETVLIEIGDEGSIADERFRGLGLSVVNYIVTEDHRGSVSVDSIPGKGTTVSIKLPLSP